MGVLGVFPKEFLVAVAASKRAKNKVRGAVASQRQAYEIGVFERRSEKFMKSPSVSWILTDYLRGAACDLQGYPWF